MKHKRKYYCKDCGKQINYNAQRCTGCQYKFNKGINKSSEK